MKNDSFNYDFIVTLKDVNMYGTVYFARYFEWQGVCRELYFMTVENWQEILKDIALVTKYAWNDYKKQIHVFDNILVKVQNRNIKKSSFEMMFTYVNKRTNEIISVGGETLIFMNNKGNIVRIPDGIIKVIQKHPYVE